MRCTSFAQKGVISVFSTHFLLHMCLSFDVLVLNQLESFVLISGEIQLKVVGVHWVFSSVGPRINN